jgi:adenylate cyclase
MKGIDPTMDGYDIDDPHRFRVRQLMTFGIPIFLMQHLLFAVLFTWQQIIPLAIFNGAATLLYLCLYLFHLRTRLITLIVLLSTLEMTLFVPITVYYVGWSAGFQFWLFTHMATVFVAYRLHRLVRVGLTVPILCNFILVFVVLRPLSAISPVPGRIETILYYYNSISVMVTVSISMFYFNIFAERAETGFHDEHIRVRSLLLNILPEKIVTRLKGKQESFAEKIDDCTILFADIVGFTGLSSRMDATELVDMLNGLFTRFDDLVDRFRLEKIKTIGDAYMAACGIPEPVEEHEQRTVECALGMLRAVEEFNTQHATSLALRIGVHTGSVVAGVIGKKKFSYDLWGDTVNIASRMESHGVAGSIQVSDQTASRLDGKFSISRRDAVEVKGKGNMITWLVTGQA